MAYFSLDNENSSVERKIISISSKRQITIPQKYFDALGFDNEAECVLKGDSIIIRPLRQSCSGEFDEQILADCNNECEKCVLEWLQQPAEEE